MKLFLSPHDDDQVLFGAFTLMRMNPLVVICTDSWIQGNRGEDITAEQRAEESRKACEILGCPVVRLGLRDDVVDEWSMKRALSRFSGFETVYIPAIQGGNKDHDLVGQVAKEVFKNVKQYTTYTSTELYTTGSEEIIPTSEEIILKHNTLDCFQSQINLPATAPHFEAVKGGKSEWFI
jgi:LmbE family N-acetylglucosaminyl deacetylase